MATVGQRIKAAQIQAGIRSVEELATLPGRPSKFGTKTIRRVIRGERALEPHEAEWLGQALGVPATSFYTDPPGTTLDDELTRVLAEIKAQLVEQTRVLNEIKGYAVKVEAMLQEQRDLKTETDEVQRLARELIEGREEDPSETQPVPRRRAGDVKKRATGSRTP